MKPWLEASGFAKKPQPAPNPFDNPFTQAMQGFFGMAKPEENSKPPPTCLPPTPSSRPFKT